MFQIFLSVTSLICLVMDMEIVTSYGEVIAVIVHLVGKERFAKWVRTSCEVIKLFSCSTQLSMKFSLLLNVKMP